MYLPLKHSLVPTQGFLGSLLRCQLIYLDTPHPSFFFWHHKGIELMHPHSLHVPDQLSNGGGLSRPLLLECPPMFICLVIFAYTVAPKSLSLGNLIFFVGRLIVLIKIVHKFTMVVSYWNIFPLLWNGSFPWDMFYQRFMEHFVEREEMAQKCPIYIAITKEVYSFFWNGVTSSTKIIQCQNTLIAI